ncbi:hypothetical protein O6H91_08G009200 [Diphasiastrum complanatum]|uniref:Uncharacterized protein n=1 Tax=Diphasiastrum complanatum TaxID=34168 RepID=A0ACC2CVR1_DIPCM|nr:hypothetical protein O6H91_08G009200 [Diphasiastrum complanatum]
MILSWFHKLTYETSNFCQKSSYQQVSGRSGIIQERFTNSVCFELFFGYITCFLAQKHFPIILRVYKCLYRLVAGGINIGPLSACIWTPIFFLGGGAGGQRPPYYCRRGFLGVQS